ncbi:unnamed protein product [Cuscuta epithymum]|nr:unnamed protein product [Cuscuta epithymum]CAH9128055.1 unnamed protein product [Cuscuta epithymum]
MSVKAANGVVKRPVFKRISRVQNSDSRVCVFWLQGKCNRSPCRFLHKESSSLHPQQPVSTTFQNIQHYTRRISTWMNPNHKYAMIGTSLMNEKSSELEICSETQKKVSITRGTGFHAVDQAKPKTKPCKSGVNDNCVLANNCKDSHAWSSGNGFSMLAKLDGHSMAITGIALPSDSSMLYSGSKDKSVRIWDCHSGQCAGVAQFDQEIGCLVSEGPCVFIGLPNVIKAWNTQTKLMCDLSATNGQIYAITVYENKLFAGTEDGTILVWKFISADALPELVASLKGHSLAVFSLIVGANRLYSASGDNTIKVWDLETLQCLQTLHGHVDTVMSVLCWDSYLISGSLDKTIKVWAATESGSMEVIYEHKEENSVLSFCGMLDAEGKPILICSCNDNTVLLYDLPSFCDRGRISTNGEAHMVRTANGGLLFTGDRAGQLCVWKLLGQKEDTRQVTVPPELSPGCTPSVSKCSSSHILTISKRSSSFVKMIPQ